MSWPLTVLTAMVAAATAWTLVTWITRLATRYALLDLPNARSSHVRPTPRLGGLGVLGGLLVGLAIGGVALGALAGVAVRDMQLVLALGAAVAAVSLLDDLRGLPALARLGVHLITAIAVVSWLGTLPLAAGLATLVSVLWVAGFLNAFNFMDGIDGIAGGQALVAALTWAAIGWVTTDTVVLTLGAAVAGAAFGFLWHNWPPATIFMGDVGSALLGFVLATLPLLAVTPLSLLVVVLPVWPFVFDTAFTMARRAVHGENLLLAHRTHLYQRLTQSGWPHQRTTLLYMALASAGAVLAVLMAAGALTSPVPGLAAIACGAAGLWWLTASRERQVRAAVQFASRNPDHA